MIDEKRLIPRSISRGKLNKLISKAWYNKDFEEYLTLLVQGGYLKADAVLYVGHKEFEDISTTWAFRSDIEHDEGNYEGWDPYCVKVYDVPKERHRQCSSPRMERTEYGWKCPDCGNMIGKHKYAIKQNIYSYKSYRETYKIIPSK